MEGNFDDSKVVACVEVTSAECSLPIKRPELFQSSMLLGSDVSFAVATELGLV